MTAPAASVSCRYDTTVLAVRGLSKSFFGKTILNDVSMHVQAGEVVGLLGQNGSGKSTLIKVVSGYYEPDPGTQVEVNGVAIDHGVDRSVLGDLDMAFVHQNLGLFDDSSVLDNLMADRWVKRGGHIHWGSVRAEARALLREFDLHVDLDTNVGTLSPGDKAVLAITRAVSELAHVEQGLLVLDEPTPYLARPEVQRLFAAMRAAAARGIGILFVSHRLDEVRDVTDRVVILRDGAVVADCATEGVDDEQLVELIVGRPLLDFYPTVPLSDVKPVLQVHDLMLPGGSQLSFEVRRGEIVGMTGLLGSGFEEIPYMLAGARTGTAGTVVVDGEELDLASLDPPSAIGHGLVLVPADRTSSVAGTMSVSDNISLPWIDRLTRGIRIDHRRECAEVSELLDRFDVRPRDPDALMSSLSGGNQQKTVLARWIAEQPRVLLLHEPTQGVDVGARRQIFAIIRDAVTQGMSVLYASLEYEDLAHMCDRVYVFRDGGVAAELTGSEISADRIADISLRQVSA
jgi:ribose transport system ATP-binding protein